VKSLANSADKQDVLRRLARVQSDSQRRWGRMSAHQMICHLADGFHLYTGEKQVAPVGGIYPSRVLRWFALWAPMKWPKGFQTMKELDQQGGGGTSPSEFARDQQELTALLERFTATPRDYTFPEHPHFGAMSERDWMRLGYLHADHHLRQFDC